VVSAIAASTWFSVPKRMLSVLLYSRRRQAAGKPEE
jgi:hypothetical protein